MFDLRLVTPGDARQIAAIYNHYVLHTDISFEVEPVSEAEMLRRILEIHPQLPFYVLEEEGRIVGYCYAHSWKDRPAYSPSLETTVYMIAGKEGQGGGRMLMGQVIEDCRQKGYKTLIACITAGNLLSRKFHENLGFRQVSLFEKVGYKLGRELDVVDYQLML